MKKTIKLLLPTVILSIFSFHGSGQINKNVADQICGLYWSPKKDAKIEIFKRGEQYFGKSVWVLNPKKDIQNPDEFLKKREVLGIELLSGFNYNDGDYNDGKVYDPGNGKTYSCKMSLNGDKLKVRGYVGVSLLGRTEIFERIK